MTTDTTAPSPLLRTVSTTATDYWNDSCAVDELEYAIANGGVGATSNPPIVLEVLKKEPERWKARARVFQRSGSFFRTSSTIGGFDVAPTPPFAIAYSSSSTAHESFQ